MQQQPPGVRALARAGAPTGPHATQMERVNQRSRIHHAPRIAAERREEGMDRAQTTLLKAPARVRRIATGSPARAEEVRIATIVRAGGRTPEKRKGLR